MAHMPSQRLELLGALSAPHIHIALVHLTNLVASGRKRVRPQDPRSQTFGNYLHHALHPATGIFTMAVLALLICPRATLPLLRKRKATLLFCFLDGASADWRSVPMEGGWKPTD